MNSHEITFSSYQTYHVPTVTRPITKTPGHSTPIFQYALPFVLLDIPAIGVAMFLYAVQKEIIPVFGAVILLYGIICFVLARMRIGCGGRYGRCLVFSYILGLIFLLVSLVIMLLVTLEVLHMLGFIGAGLFMVITNVMALPDRKNSNSIGIR